MLIEQASATRRPSSPSRHARAWSMAPPAAAWAMKAASSMRSRPSVADSVSIFGSADVVGRGVLEEAVEHADAVEAGHGGQPPADGGPGQAPFLHGAGPQLQVAPLQLEDAQVHRAHQAKNWRRSLL